MKSTAYELMSYAVRTLCVPYNPEDKFESYVSKGYLDQGSARFLDQVREEIIRSEGLGELYNAGNLIYAEDHDCLADVYNEYYYRAVEEDHWFQEPEDTFG
ncbi:hypothetical protein EBR43_05075 [bacterium]|nr:hypothetical protein [bacterium]